MLLFPDVKILPGYQYFEQHTVYILSRFHVFSERFPKTFKEHSLQELRTQCNSPTYLTFLSMMQPSCPVDSNITNLLGKKLWQSNINAKHKHKNHSLFSLILHVRGRFSLLWLELHCTFLCKLLLLIATEINKMSQIWHEIVHVWNKSKK